MTIRTALGSDLAALARIHDAAITDTDATCFLTPFTEMERMAWWGRHRDPRHPILVAEEKGVIVGYAALSAWMPGPVYARTVEVGLFLDEGARGRGLGTDLLRALLREASQVGHHVVVARVWSHNAASLALCRKCGFTVVGVQREVGWRRGAWEDCVVLQRVLPEAG